MFVFPTFPNVADLEIHYQMVEEYCDRHFPFLDYERLIPPTEAELDAYHSELPERLKRWMPTIKLRAYALPSEQSHPMTIFGIEELRDVVLFASVPSLVRVGLATRNLTTKEVALVAKAGDRFYYSGRVWYDILEWRIGRTFANSDLPIEFQAIAERVRYDAGIPTQRQQDDANG